MGAFPETYSPDVIKMVTEKRIRTLKEMRKRSWSSVLKNAHYGYGWRIYDIGGGELIYHGGSVAGFRSEVAYSMEKGLALVILLNAETRMGSELNSKFWTEVFREAPKPKIIKNSRKILKVNSSIIPRDKPASILTSK
jgi:beta-lactamase class C